MPTRLGPRTVGKTRGSRSSAHLDAMGVTRSGTKVGDGVAPECRRRSSLTKPLLPTGLSTRVNSWDSPPGWCDGSDRSHELLGIDRLHQIGVEVGSRAALIVPRLPKAGEREQMHLRPPRRRSQPAGNLVAVHS